MILIVGLGNPGRAFQKTRHNLGFLALDYLKKTGAFSPWEKREEFKAKVSFGEIEGKKLLLVKPQTFMNNSGKAVRAILEKYRLGSENLIVIHDDLGLPLGRIKFSFGKSSGGHKGVESIIQEIKTKEFFRIRIGIGKRKGKKKDFVLGKMTPKEEKIIKEGIKKIKTALFLSLEKNIQALGNFLK